MSKPVLGARAWSGLLDGLRKDAADIALVGILEPNKDGASGVFLGRADDGNRYWIKPLNNAQGSLVSVSEQIVGRVGLLINAPVCTVRTIAIPKQMEGAAYCHTRALQPGIAHACLDIRYAQFMDVLEHRLEDDNQRRHAYLFALYDWCWGCDDQWLTDLLNENRYYSHDHGYYLCPHGYPWKRQDLLECVAEPRELEGSTRGVSRQAVASVASSLRQITRKQIVSVLAEIPESWIGGVDLEAVGYFLEYRAPLVADRLEKRFGIL